MSFGGTAWIRTTAAVLFNHLEVRVAIVFIIRGIVHVKGQTIVIIICNLAILILLLMMLGLVHWVE